MVTIPSHGCLEYPIVGSKAEATRGKLALVTGGGSGIGEGGPTMCPLPGQNPGGLAAAPIGLAAQAVKD
jgi:hypothetical protein